MTEQSQTRTSKIPHSLKQTKKLIGLNLCSCVVMGSQLEMKGLDSALMSTLMIMTDPRLPTQKKCWGQYLVCCQ